MSTLMIAPQDSIVSRSDLASLTPEILAMHTHSHKPRPFADVIDMAHDELERANYRIGEEQYVLARNNTQLFALLEIVNFRNGVESKLSYAIRTSTNKTLAESHALAMILTICTNLDLWARESMNTKNTRFINDRVRSMVRNYVAQVSGLVDQRRDTEAMYKTTLMNEMHAALAVKRMYDNGVINTQRVGRVFEEYDNPSHEQHLGPNGEHTCWTLFNAVTECFKGSPLNTYNERCDGLHNVIGNAANKLHRRGLIIDQAA